MSLFVNYRQEFPFEIVILYSLETNNPDPVLIIHHLSFAVYLLQWVPQMLDLALNHYLVALLFSTFQIHLQFK